MESKENPAPEKNLVFLFPLPATVFFPGTLLPLHIFEPRYCEMMADALENDPRIGMVLLKPGWEADYFGRPEITAVGCLGEIHSHTHLPDGKYNLVLKGLSRFRIRREIAGKSYRRAEIELLQDIHDCPLGNTPQEERDRLVEPYRRFTGLLPESERQNLEANWNAFATLAELVDQMAFRLQPAVEEKQALLEELDVEKRAAMVQAMLDLKIRLARVSSLQTRKGIDIRMN
jgi:Lon protease-like protein